MHGLSPHYLVLGHIKCVLAGRRFWSFPGALSLVVVFGLPLVAGLYSLDHGWQHQNVGSLLTAVSILAGGALSAFTHLSTLRAKLTDREEQYGHSDELERRMMDFAATHLLMTVLASVVTAAVLVVALSTTPANLGVPVQLSAVLNGLLTYLAILFLLSVPRLYNAYIEMNHVSAAWAGNKVVRKTYKNEAVTDTRMQGSHSA